MCRGARLLTGSYYGQMVALWAALLLAALLAALCVWSVSLAQLVATRGRGGQL